MSAREGSNEKELAPDSKKTDEKQAAPESKNADAKPAAPPKSDAKPVAADKGDGSDKSDETPAPAAKAEDKPAAAAPKSEDAAPKSDAKPPAPAAKPQEAELKPPPMAKPAGKPAARPASTNGNSAGTTRTVGINLSAAAKFTTLVAIEWSNDGACVSEAIVDLEDDELIGYLSSGDRTGVYAPFGWPVAMVEAVSSYTNSDQWQRASRRQFRHRETEAFVHDILQAEADQELWPQSVSCDRLALQARRMAQLREQLFTETGKRFDRAGGDNILEVYTPGASLLWGLNSHSANGLEVPPDASEKPGLLFIERVEAAAPWLQWKEGKRGVCLKNEHTSDALLAALVARAAERDLTIRPENGHLDLARREGWMHLPSKGSLPALTGAS